jgi:4a-hydroxytetrahydrobiopterin dehydratase
MEKTLFSYGKRKVKNMSQLNQDKCVVCRTTAPRVTDSEIAEFKPQIPEWQLLTRDEILRLERIFQFRNFRDALAFTDKVGELAESEGHHPAILTEWGKVTITWWTHAIRGLHRNDFIMAAKTDALITSKIPRL